jgi:hypothetical protein
MFDSKIHCRSEVQQQNNDKPRSPKSSKALRNQNHDKPISLKPPKSSVDLKGSRKIKTLPEQQRPKNN